jgi:hypothetical protein
VRKIVMYAAVGALLVGGAAPSSASAATPTVKSLAKAVKKLQHDNKVLAARSRSLMAFVGCLQYVNLTQYGDAAGTFGYTYDSMDGGVSAPFQTTAIDVTADGDDHASFLILDPACGARSARSSVRGARSFGAGLSLPEGAIGHGRR